MHEVRSTGLIGAHYLEARGRFNRDAITARAKAFSIWSRERRDAGEIGRRSAATSTIRCQKCMSTVGDISPLLDEPFWQWTPLILAPSTTKLYRAQPLRDFWWGAQRAGGLNLGFGIVGYSLPIHDEYSRQVLFYMTRNYTDFEPDFELGGRRKARLRVLDLRGDTPSRQHLRDAYRFLNPERSEYWFDGLSAESLNWLFASPRG